MKDAEGTTGKITDYELRFFDCSFNQSTGLISVIH